MNLVYYPDPVLLKKAASLPFPFDPDLAEKAEKMFSIMNENEGVGLAAPQVGWSVRLFVMCPTGDPSDNKVVINPKILKKWGREVGEEGCLSLPKIHIDVRRHLGIELEYVDLSGVTQVETLESFDARVAQHEFDHLEGILLIHKMSLAERIVNRKALKNLESAAS